MRTTRLQTRVRRPRTEGIGPRTAAIGLLASLVLASVPVEAAEDEPTRRTEVEEVQKVRLVLLPTTVTTPRGRPVRALEREDFRLFEDGEAREIGLFATEENAPIALAFLLDLSGSMTLRDRIGEARRAIRYLVEQLEGDDRIALIGFAEERVRWIAGFDDDRATFLERLDTCRPAGKTALYDALAATPHLVDEEIRGRKAIVLITDGVDNASEIPELKATWIARHVAVPIYTLGFIPLREKLLPLRAREALRVLRRFSDETGGALLAVHGAEDLERAARTIQGELRFQYVIGFYPPEQGRDGTFRVLQLATGRKRLTVRTRRGYYADP